MKLYNEKIKKLEEINVPKTAQPDFNKFWDDACEKVKNAELNVKKNKLENYPMPGVDVYDLTYEGLDGTPISTWLLLPKKSKIEKVPVVVSYHGYSYYKGEAISYAKWMLMGVAVIAIDFRLQGGKTGCYSGFDDGFNNYHWMTGILDSKKSYVYHIVTDALLALKLAREIPEIDSEKIAVSGHSQGGGMSLQISALDNSVALCIALAPSSSCYEKRIMDQSGGGNDLAQYIRKHPERMDLFCKNLSYFDSINHTENIKCPVLVGMGMNDPVCTPDTVYASYNKIKSEKRIINYPFSEHDAESEKFEIESAKFFKEYLLTK